jgi:hypothetical protein
MTRQSCKLRKYACSVFFPIVLLFVNIQGLCAQTDDKPYLSADDIAALEAQLPGDTPAGISEDEIAALPEGFSNFTKQLYNSLTRWQLLKSSYTLSTTIMLILQAAPSKSPKQPIILKSGEPVKYILRRHADKLVGIGFPQNGHLCLLYFSPDSKKGYYYLTDFQGNKIIDGSSLNYGKSEYKVVISSETIPLLLIDKASIPAIHKKKK